MKSKYTVKQNPNDDLWYVIGYCGRNGAGRAQWMPVSSGFSSKALAQAQIARQMQADGAARMELHGV